MQEIIISRHEHSQPIVCCLTNLRIKPILLSVTAAEDGRKQMNWSREQIIETTRASGIRIEL